MKRIKWPQDWNRPLSEEELEIAKRLDNAPDRSPELAPTPKSWHSAVTQKLRDEEVVSQPEEA